MANPLSGFIGDTLKGISDVLDATGVGKGLSGVDKIANLVAIGLADVLDPAMWKSLGWMALGFFLVVIGLIYLLRKPAGSALKSGAKVAGTAATVAVLA